MRSFLHLLPRTYRHTVEFRHQSWFTDAVFALLRDQQVALCIADHPELPQSFEVTAPWTYVRFHAGTGDGGNYTVEQLARWAGRFRCWLENGTGVWAHFNNDWYGYALQNARDLKCRLFDCLLPYPPAAKGAENERP